MCDIYEALVAKGIRVEMFSSSNKDSHKKRVIEKMKHGFIDVLVATIAFGVGIDIRNIRSVVCYYAPENLSILMQQFGRGGRDGNPCKCYLFYPTQGYISSELQTFIKGQQCFRKQFFNYFDVQETHEVEICCSICSFVPQTQLVIIQENKETENEKKKKEEEKEKKKSEEKEKIEQLKLLREELQGTNQEIFNFYGLNIFSDSIIQKIVESPENIPHLPKFIREEVEKLFEN